MHLDPESAIDASLNHEERAVVALEAIADALTAWSKLEQQKFELLHPQRTPSDATITKVKDKGGKLRVDLGDDGSQSLEEWVDIGKREQEVIQKKRGSEI